MPLSVDGIEIEGIASPFRKLCMAQVLGVSDGFEEFLVTPGPADVFRVDVWTAGTQTASSPPSGAGSKR